MTTSSVLTRNSLFLLLTLGLTFCSPSRELTTVNAQPADTEIEAVVPDAKIPPLDWHLMSSDQGYPGISLSKAYEILLKGKTPSRTVRVAVIDGGTDVSHEDLSGVVWKNSGEVAGNGLDDDGNGYMDDIHGWNFIGGADGKNVGIDTYEVTRELARLTALFEGQTADSVEPEMYDLYDYYMEVQDAYEEKRAEAEQSLPNISFFLSVIPSSKKTLQEYLKVDELTPELVAGVPDNNPMLAQAKQIMSILFDNGITEKDLAKYQESLETDLAYRFDTDFDPRSIVGDDYDNPEDRLYGNADVTGPDADHGTHVAGIIAAIRGNGIGMDGVASGVEVMVVRAVPDGDERDKDVANAIRYATDNGAHVINMSFGKAFAPKYEVVQDAIRYAGSKGVLMIHASGNDGEDIDEARNFPNPWFEDDSRSDHWLEIGASSWKTGDMIVAEFSNYGKESVDFFAPGVDIYSTYPNNTYKDEDGTSMAAPVVTGVAAMLMAYFPELTAGQVRTILIETVDTSNGDRFVVRPGTDGDLVKFNKLSRTGGILNAYSAIQRAMEMSGSR